MYVCVFAKIRKNSIAFPNSNFNPGFSVSLYGLGCSMRCIRGASQQHCLRLSCWFPPHYSSSPDSPDKRLTIEVIGHKAHGTVPEPGSIVLARVTKVMARMASADIMCVGPKSVREKFTGIIRKAALPLKPPFDYLLSHWDEMAGSGGRSGGPWV
ncbi:hypothetical protein L6164_035220 [Bauhinia variegata]|uniref:Uncharacterized protein n=1 Tax=Bauhinia variegata TaxID=167791 RepID=A0ACB9KXU5_BAUVA|nr:hypothetical protein L6164_035220 [Bauhinia variegata]